MAGRAPPRNGIRGGPHRRFAAYGLASVAGAVYRHPIMRYFLDTEFNGFGGTLISVALVPEHGDDDFYASLPLPEAIGNEWRHGLVSLAADTLTGAARFASGQGRHGAFDGDPARVPPSAEGPEGA